VTGATRANPVVVTVPGHGWSNDDFVDFEDIAGMVELNGQRYQIANVTTDTFELQDGVGNNIDGTGFSAYTSGGEARKAIITLGGLTWLEGETVNILGDGAVRPQATVTGGEITLDQRASVLQVGLPITADLRVLPLTLEMQAFGQGREKNVNQVWVRVAESSGIKAGPDFDNLTEIKQRTTEPYGTPPALVSAELSVVVKPSWGPDGSLCIRQSNPLPLTLCSMALEVAIGA
jgi:hypothetical protein